MPLKKTVTALEQETRSFKLFLGKVAGQRLLQLSRDFN
ncbi:hypothetical protein PAE0015 [Pyrobaculum aerophilum str. IM2]|uniref:Uncharacterized protein n=1 Tax=Pyrobaculum aerophilum (strain ATCC 51768 / DSM 7523 / JCM 9630 / CIP 104966 / NBRC 100827 / IM2) TaxID=178306 RepID=Q8ZZY6_PYRAE|nr:hypothetical protein PAE0015 [Pyrobaculum aerophilum str. IM2]